MKKLANIINKHLTLVVLLLLVILWEVMVKVNSIPSYILPSFSSVIKAIAQDHDLLLHHSLTTLTQAFIGIVWAIILGYIFAVLIDYSLIVRKIVYPLIILSQTIPTIVIAPILVIWLGYGMTTKIVVVFLVCFFPITMALLKGFDSIDHDIIKLFQSMNASKIQIIRHVKLKASLLDFFNGLKVAITYAIVGSVIAEWLGGEQGLGVYMIRVKKSFAYDKVFAVVIIISLISFMLIKLIEYISKKAMPWNVKEN